jgi:hypothetical protein
MIRKESLYFMIFVIVVGALAIVFHKRGTTSDPCEIHRELFTIEIDSGRITNKYIDRDNHAIKTVIVNAEGKDYSMLFIPYDNWTDFDKIKINDVITKNANSFTFTVNNEFGFTLKLECKFN